MEECKISDDVLLSAGFERINEETVDTLLQWWRDNLKSSRYNEMRQDVLSKFTWSYDGEVFSDKYLSEHGMEETIRRHNRHAHLPERP